MKQALRAYFKSDIGAAAIESAFIFPFMLFLYFGLVDITGLVTYNRKITSSASSIADTVAQNVTPTYKDTVKDYFNVIGMIAWPTPETSVHAVVYDYRLNGSNTPILQWSVANDYLNQSNQVTQSGPSCDPITPSTLVPLMSSNGKNNDVVVAVTCVMYTPYVATFFGKNVIGATSFKLQQVITTRPRAQATLDCYVSQSSTTACS